MSLTEVFSRLDRDVILASGSPRRRQLLTEAGVRLRVIKPSESAECGTCSGESPPELVARLATQKALDVAQRVDSPALIIACDTVACCRGRVLGKPRDLEDARRMLELLSGSRHDVFSGLCILLMPERKMLVDVARTELIMDQLEPSQLEQYLAGGQWEGKAGAFGYQDGVDWLTIRQGSESNVVGLPMELLEQMVERLLGTTRQR